MVNSSLVEAILLEQDNPSSSTTRQIRDIYNIRSGEDPIAQHSDQDKEFQSILFKTLATIPAVDSDEDEPISYTVKLKDKKPSTASSITLTKPFSPLFLNNMKKFGVSTDWLAKRSNSLRQTAYSRSSVKSNASKLDEMIKSASCKPIRSNRKLSFIEPTTPTKLETDKENADPSIETTEKKDESKDLPTTTTTPYDLSSEIEDEEEDKDNENNDDLSPTSKEFSLRIPRVNHARDENKRASKRTISSSSSSTLNESQQETPKPKSKKKNKKETKNPPVKRLSKKKSKDKQVTTDDTTASPSKNDKDEEVPNDDTEISSPKNEDDEQTKTKKNPTTKRSSKKKSKDKQVINDDTLVSPSKDEQIPNDDTEISSPKNGNDQQPITKKSSTTKRSSKKKSKDKQVITDDTTVSPSKDEQTPNDDTEINTSKNENDEQSTTTTNDKKKPSQKKDKNDQGQSRIEHLKKLLRISGIRLIIKKTELEELKSHKAKINYLKSLFDTAGYTGSLTIKDCQKFREKRDTEKELLEIQSTSVDVTGHVKGGRTLRGQGRTADDDESDFTGKRKRRASSEIADNAEMTKDDNSSNDEKPIIKKRRVLKMEASPEVSDNE
ncbi:unnamed protein product [Adineta steineri]|uniref:Uncharacterized protein n=2 Tax=Adineta steineri TaxID=433720 RepID=A0A818JYW3_9BILA|nr:unnamed protein product [Adineta steineri]